jgi:hypothetical protein
MLRAILSTIAAVSLRHYVPGIELFLAGVRLQDLYSGITAPDSTAVTTGNSLHMNGGDRDS